MGKKNHVLLEMRGTTERYSQRNHIILSLTSIKTTRSLQWGVRITQFCRIKGCGGAGCPPPPIIFKRLKLPQQIIYRRKGNLLESPNHQKYWGNILISRFYEQFSRSSRNLDHFGSSKKFQTLRTQTYRISF